MFLVLAGKVPDIRAYLIATLLAFTGIALIVLKNSGLPFADGLRDALSLEIAYAETIGGIEDILLVPFGAVIVVFVRLTLGLRMLGPFRSILIAIGMNGTGIPVGVTFFVAVTLLMLWIRPQLAGHGLSYFGRLSILLITVVLLEVSLALVGTALDIRDFVKALYFPIVVLCLAAEGFGRALAVEGKRSAMFRGATTLGTALLIYLAQEIPGYYEHMLEYPETILIEIAAIVFIAKGLNFRLLSRLNPVAGVTLAGPPPAPDVALRFADDVMLERRARRRDPTAWSSVSAEGMVASAHYRATAAGVRVLEAGGNAVDAAVAVSAALGVCEPAGSGLGGMTMMMVHLAGAGRTVAIEGPCRAPAAATPEAVLAAKKRYSGYPAVAVPTNAAVLGHALARYGTRRPAEVLAPAIQLAEEGYPLTAFQHEVLEHHSRPLARQAGGRHLLRDGMPLPVGAQVCQPELAATLRRLGEAGFEDFYTGAIGRRIVEDMQRHGGFLGEADFAEVPWPRETDPMRSRYRALDVFTLAPPGGGVALLQMLKLHELLGREGADPDAPDTAVMLASIIRRARADRRRHGLALTPGNTTPILLEADHNAAAAREIRTELGGGGETSHFVTADRWGNLVSTTQSIERSFGAKVATADLGFLYNGFMKAFKVRNRAHPHFLRPGAVARSNAAPTIVLHGDRPWAALGSTGSERSTSIMFQVLVRLFLQSPFEAVHAPRLHCTPEGLVLLEKERFSVGVIAALEKAGLSLVEEPSYAFKLGGLQLLATDRDGFVGVADPRRDGAAGGPGGIGVPEPVESED